MNLVKGSRLALCAVMVVLLGFAGIAQAQPLSGAYTIGGSSPSYATFAAAVSDLSSKGVNGPVVFNVRTGTYTEQININAVTGSTGTNTITFQSETGTASDVTLQFSNSSSGANYVIGLTGASHIRILNMTLTSTGVSSSYRNVIRMDGTSASVNDIIIRGNTFDGYIGSSSSSDLSLINAVPNSIMTGINIQYNTFTHGAYALYLYGNGSTPSTGTVVKANQIANAYGGMYLLFQAAVTVDSNTVNVSYDGIDLSNCGNPLGVSQLLVQRNRVVITANGYGIQLNSSNGNVSHSGLVTNNFLTGGVSGYLLSASGTSYLNIYYNSVNMTGGASGYAFYQSGTAGYNIENNVFMNSGGGYAAYIGNPTAISVCDHNDYYSYGGMWLANWGGTSVGDLAAFQAASGMDAHSVSANPNYTSSTDLHVNSPWLDGTGAVVSVTTDIFGAARSGSTPDMGAVEFTSSLSKLPGGTYTIGGSSPSYATFTNAVADLNTRGIAGAVTFNVRTGSYNEQVNLASVAGSSPTNTVTFKSESGVMSDVTLFFAQSQSDASLNYVFLLNSASHVRVRNMTLVSDGVGTTYRNVLVLNGNVNDLVVQGDSLKGYLGTNNSSQNLALLYGWNDQMGNLTITNNHFGSGSYGIEMYAANSGGAFGTVVKGNVFNNQGGYGGIYLNNHAAAVVDSNSVYVMSDGIDLNNCGDVSGIPQVSVQRNRVVVSANGYGIFLGSCSGNASYSGLVANNLVSMSGSGAEGIGISSCSYINVFYNSVNSTTYNNGYAFYVAGGSSGIMIENNVFLNAGGGYAYYSSSTGVATSNHNDLYSIGGSWLGYWNGSYAADLAAFQTASGQDGNSVSANPLYTSFTDLHVNSPWIDGKAVVIAGLTTDYYGAARNGSTPDMGAVEFTSSLTKLAGGTYTIGGSSPNYATFTDAVTDLNTRGITGAVTFNARAGSYNEQLNLAPVAGSSPTNTVTFTSESGVMSDVTLHFAQSQSDPSVNFVFLLNSAEHLRIRNMTLVSDGVGTTYRNVLVLNGNVNDLVVQGDSLRGYIGTNNSSQSLALLYGWNVLMGSLTFNYNHFGSGSYGIEMYAANSGGASGTTVKGNVFYNAGGYGGIYLNNHAAVVVDSNTVYAISDGIDLNNCGNAAGINQLLVQRNRVVVTGNAYGIYVGSSSGNASYSGLIANNIISASGNGSEGIGLGSDSYINVFYNSVNVTSSGSYSMYVSGGSAGIVVENNIFMNAGGGYAYYASSSGIATSDHNDLYTIGGPWLGFWNGTYAGELAGFQSASSQEGNSVSANPLFTTFTDLHANSPWIDGKAVVIAGLTTDYYGTARGGTPDIGAVEFTSSLTKLPGGIYTIGGSSPNYATFSAAVADLNTRGIAGAVTFNARTGSYNEQVNLAPVAGSSPTNTVTFESENGVMGDVSLHFAQSQTDASVNYVFLLNSADHVRVRNMTLISDGVGTTYRNVLVLNGNVTDLVVEGDSLRGYVGSNNSSQNLALLYGWNIYMGNLTITNNHFGNGSYGIELYAANSGGALGTLVKANKFFNAGGYGGMYLYNHQAVVVDSNYVNAISDGINLNSCGNTAGVQQALIQRNRVLVSGNANGIQVNNTSGNASYSGLLVNNFIVATGSGAYALQTGSSSYLNVYYNSVNMVGGGSSSICFYHSGGTGDVVENNIFMNGGGGYCYYTGSPSGIALSDYNVLWTTGANIAYWNGNQATVALLQTANGMDANTFWFPVEFTSLTDLHLAGTSLGSRWLLGTPITGITTDIDGNPRSATKPYKGANEGSTPLSVDSKGKVTANGMEVAPVEYQLLQNYPNPFNPSTEVKFSVATAGRTTIDLFNILGEHVSTLFDETTEPGVYYRVTVNGNSLASGTYFYVIKSGSYNSVRKMLLLK